MNHETKSIKPLLALALLAGCISISAWKYADEGNQKNNQANGIVTQADTSKPRKRAAIKNEYVVGNGEEISKAIDKAMAEINAIDFSSMQKEIEIATKEIKAVNVAKINDEIQTALKQIDCKKITLQIDSAMKQINIHLKKIDLEKSKNQLENIKVQLEKEKIKFSTTPVI